MPQVFDVVSVAGLLLGMQFGPRPGETLRAYRIRTQYQAAEFDACIARLIACKVRAEA